MRRIVARLLIALAAILPAAAWASPESRADFIRTAHQLIIPHGRGDSVPGKVAVALKLSEGSTIPACGLEWKADDTSYRGVDAVGDDLVVGFMPSDHSHVLTWRLSASGKTLATAFWDRSGKQIPSSADSSDELDQQVDYWNHLLARADVQWGANSCAPKK